MNVKEIKDRILERVYPEVFIQVTKYSENLQEEAERVGCTKKPVINWSAKVEVDAGFFTNREPRGDFIMYKLRRLPIVRHDDMAWALIPGVSVTQAFTEDGEVKARFSFPFPIINDFKHAGVFFEQRATCKTHGNLFQRNGSTIDAITAHVQNLHPQVK